MTTLCAIINTLLHKCLLKGMSLREYACIYRHVAKLFPTYLGDLRFFNIYFRIILCNQILYY